MVQLQIPDYITFTLYCLGFAVVGLIAGRKRQEAAADFFIQQNKLPWFVIGFSLIAAGVSSEQFIGTVGAVYSRGLVTANWEWGNVPAVLVMVTFFIPYYLQHKIVTIPQYLEKRFNRKVRILYAVLSILIYVFINLAGVLYSGAFAMSQILHIDYRVCIWMIACTVGFFSIYGGMASLAWVSVWQSIMLIGSGITLFVLGLIRVEGGWTQIIGTGQRSHLIQPVTDLEIPWTAILVLMFSTNVWYYCTSQNINQSALGAKSEWHAKMGLIFAGLLWIFIPLADVFPGLIAYALNPSLPKADMAFVYVTNELIPTGGSGFVYAILIFAVVTAILSGINGVATMFTFDLYQPLSARDLQEKDLIRTGRYFAAVVLLTGCLYAPMVGRFSHIFDFFQQCWAFVAVPISITFLLCILSKRMNAQLAYGLLLLTFPMFLMPYVVKLLEIPMNIYNIAGILWIIILSVSLVYIYFFSKPSKENTTDILPASAVYPLPVQPWYVQIRFWAIIMILCYACVYFLFW